MTDTPMLRRKIRFSQAAHGAGVTRFALRKWLRERKVRLMSDHRDCGWREFSIADVALLGLVRELQKFGASVEEADALAHEILPATKGPEPDFECHPQPLLAAWLGDLNTKYLLIGRDAAGVLRWDAYEPGNDGYTPARGWCERDGRPEKLLEDKGVNSAVLVNLSGVVVNAVDRATDAYPGDDAARAAAERAEGSA